MGFSYCKASRPLFIASQRRSIILQYFSHHGDIGEYLSRNISEYEYSIAGNVRSFRFETKSFVHVLKYEIQNKESWYCARCPTYYHHYRQIEEVRLLPLVLATACCCGERSH